MLISAQISQTGMKHQAAVAMEPGPPIQRPSRMAISSRTKPLAITRIVCMLPSSDRRRSIRRRRALLRLYGARPAQPHVKRAFAAVTDMGGFEAEHEAAKLRRVEPVRHQAAEHAAFAERIGALFSLAGDHKNDPCPSRLGGAQE